MDQGFYTRIRGGAIVASVFFVIAIALSGLLPLWLDEIIQLRVTRIESPVQFIAAVRNQPGASPLGYLFQKQMLQATGYSERLARLPSALFVAGTVFVVAGIAAELGMKAPWISAALFALFPLTVRYASESRVYSQAILFSTLATYLFLRHVKNPGWRSAILYWVALTAAVYTQPYSIFIAPALTLGATFRGQRKAAWLSALAFLAALGAFLPWYLASRSHWAVGLSHADVHFAFSAKTPLMLFRELVGAGYWGSGLLAILGFIAWRTAESRVAQMLTLLIGITVLIAITADAATGYFVAARQIMWVMPAVALLAGLAIEQESKTAVPISLLLAAVCIWQSVHYFTSPREDWSAAAGAIANKVSQGACLIVAPAELEATYEYFRPELAKSTCPSTNVVLALTPYTTPAQREQAISALTAQGYSRQSSTDTGKSDISIFVR